MATTTTGRSEATGAPHAAEHTLGRHEDLGWHLGVLLRAYRATVEETLDDVPHGTRGYQVLVTVAQGEQPTQPALAEHHASTAPS
ncbi:hypothetical protein [Cellulosimicrobium sp. CUA-896]|uniref:hypothetical protein n=1 Tax=Cellulosimicrobium sp. CUA-896 TaxID=1517881 RepID=UPI001C9E96F9|nr:hypothetical protein [Cellulosimicrobium sp. CUA-896]